MQLREKLILEEPEDEVLPPALPDEPIVVSTKPECEVETTLSDVEEPVEKVDDEIERNAYASLLMNEISATYESIDRLNSIIATVTDKFGEDVVSQLNSLVDGRTLEIGALHTILATIDPKTGDLIYDGMQGAEKPEEEPEVEFASAKYDDEIVDEKVTRADKRIAKELNKHLSEGSEVFGLFAYEIDPNTGRKIADYNDGEYIELSYDRKHLLERAKLFADSWNANRQGKVYKFIVKSLGIR